MAQRWSCPSCKSYDNLIVRGLLSKIHDYMISVKRVVEQAIRERWGGPPLPNRRAKKNPTAVKYPDISETMACKNANRLSMPCRACLVPITWCVLSACQPMKMPGDGRPASNRFPSATEVFNLRSRCAALGEKILAGNIVVQAYDRYQVSHYNPETNHCYVKLTVLTADAAIDYLYDGQTQEVLATATVTPHSTWGWISSSSLRRLVHHDGSPSYEETQSLIDKFVAEDRRP